jgi:hypothetical protein
MRMHDGLACGCTTVDADVENAQRAHSPLLAVPLAAGLASELKNSQNSLHLGDSLQLAAGFFNFPEGSLAKDI